MSKEDVKPGDKYFLRDRLDEKHTELRWGLDNGIMPSLHSGQFIVERVDGNVVDLADASWRTDGVITYHSTKHGHRVTLDIIKKLKKVVI